MDSLFHWLAGKPYRATILNVFMLTALLVVIASPALFRVVGLPVLLLAAAHFVWRALHATRQRGVRRNLYGLLLTWLPGLLAGAMAFGALHLVAGVVALDWRFLLGALLFGCEIALLLLAADGFAEAGAANRAAAE